MNVASGTREVTMDEIGDITDYIQDESCSECPFIRKKEDNTTVKSEKV